MNNNLDTYYKTWNRVTGALPWGVNAAFKAVLELAAEDKTHLVYGADYSQGMPCLVNTVGSMLKVGGGSGIPSSNFGDVVSTFDSLNRELASVGVNTDNNLVSPLAADILLQHFCTVEIPELGTSAAVNVPTIREENLPWTEPTDEDMITAISSMFEQDAPAEAIAYADPQVLEINSLVDGD